jgi:hypothetical protein
MRGTWATNRHGSEIPMRATSSPLSVNLYHPDWLSVVSSWTGSENFLLALIDWLLHWERDNVTIYVWKACQMTRPEAMNEQRIVPRTVNYRKSI